MTISAGTTLVVGCTLLLGGPSTGERKSRRMLCSAPGCCWRVYRLFACNRIIYVPPLCPFAQQNFPMETSRRVGCGPCLQCSQLNSCNAEARSRSSLYHVSLIFDIFKTLSQSKPGLNTMRHLKSSTSSEVLLYGTPHRQVVSK